MNTYEFLPLLKDRVDLEHVPFTDRGSRILVMRQGSALTMRLAERWFKLSKSLAAYRERPPIVNAFFFTDGEGNNLPLDVTSEPHRVDFRSQAGTFSMVFSDQETVLVGLPEGACGFVFQAHVDQGLTDRRGGILAHTGDIRRNLAYTSNRAMRQNTITLLEPDLVEVRVLFEPGAPAAVLFNLTPRLGFNRYVPDLNTALKAAADRWETWFASVPRVDEPYRETYYYAWMVMRNGLISTRFFLTREAMTPSKTFYVGVWQWDAYFHALAYRHIDRRLAEDQFRIMLDHQRADGMIPDAVHDEGTVTRLDHPVEADVTKPPLLAWAAWKLYESFQDVEFLREIYEPIVRWNQWWFEKNDLDGDGLCEYLHPYSSGLDDSPLWDEGTPVTAPDLNTYLVLQMECLAKMAREIGLENEAPAWEARAQELVTRMVERMWDPEAGLFWAMHGGLPVRVKTPFNLFPLLTGRLPAEIANRLVEHLTNPVEFWPEFPVPTVALDDRTFNPTRMWRGPVWVNSNYLMVEGLERAGFQEIANELRRRTLDLVSRHRDIFEYYNPLDGSLSPTAAPTFGWSAALFIDLALQHQAQAAQA